MTTFAINPNSKINYSFYGALGGASFVVLAGIIVILAANKIIPSGTSPIHKLGVWGQIAGSGVIGGGLLVIAIVSVQKSLSHKENPPIKRTIYINSLSSGPIRKDRHFEFSKRIQTKDRRPIFIAEKDLYLELGGDFEEEERNFLFKDKEGNPNYYLHLPFSLFKDKKEGESICFYYENRKVELVCTQMLHPHPKFQCKFEEALESVKMQVLLKRNQYCWKEDVEGEISFLGVDLGQSHFLFNQQENERIPFADFSFYTKDQDENGPYQLLAVRARDTDFFQFNIHQNRVALSEIHVIESFGFNDLYQVWLVIPHKPKYNQYPESEGASTLTAHRGNEQISYTKETFDQKKGARLATYHYGQFFPFSIRNLEAKINLNFNENGWLELSVV